MWQEELRCEASLEKLPTLLTWVRAQIERSSLISKKKKRFELAVEEAIVNILHYAYPSHQLGEMILIVKGNSKQLDVIIRDQGISFNPLLQESKDQRDLNLQDMEVGGMGIAMIKKYADVVSYERKESFNELKLTAFCQ
jgi:serine/threonine-protein kinase RsbW